MKMKAIDIKNFKWESEKAENCKQIYATGAQGGFTGYDFRMGFYNELDANEKDKTVSCKVISEVIMPPLAVKELIAWLSEKIGEYEKVMGEIEPLTSLPSPRKSKKDK